MKRIILLTASCIFVAASINAQIDNMSMTKQEKIERKELRKLNGRNVSEEAKEQFKIDFGVKGNVSWKRSANFDEVVFMKDHVATTAYYDEHANLVGTTAKKTYADLPAKARTAIAEQYKGFQPKQVIFFDDNEANETDMMLFNTQFDDVDSYFAELKKDNKDIILQISMKGDVTYFTRL